ncbi:uncharacterized protein PHACADRAFT_253153 [Phanerochaete carnosa HHB-10118-sp]|uniref:Secreted protein n=1 Tax=Phanerochaete carnosa (strain HHB-10118-sp) TaxID=650164 RepID=K5W444_PHACS|nr:uncharacterized protein PHACADRAFT_253153 [Phanerochaete carnosa HHB-10118-sp]EKM58668.1 hypothetical protein PHACADRAFT_253153 [Phanerochaete carnosa HHB-10118-sp]
MSIVVSTTVAVLLPGLLLGVCCARTSNSSAQIGHSPGTSGGVSPTNASSEREEGEGVA